MAMTILNNSATIMTLGELNRNITKVGKSLSVLSTGQKIKNASDGASAYAISERMQAKLRALEQDVQNVQNGSSMLKTALGGIENVVSEIRELKQLAIDAANDSNTDDDRRVMQKVVQQKQANIDYIAASTSFNNKTLLDGTYAEPHWREVHRIEYGGSGFESPADLGADLENTVEKSLTFRKVGRENIINDSASLGDIDVSKIVNNDVTIYVRQRQNTVEGLASAFAAMTNGVTFADGTRAVETRETALYAQRPKDIKPDSVTPNYNFIRSSGGAPLAVRVDFSGARAADGSRLFDSNGKIIDIGKLQDQLNGQGFTILSSDSSHFVNIKFGDATEWDHINSVSDGEHSDAGGDYVYTVDINSFDGANHADFVNYIFNELRDCDQRTEFLRDSEKYGNDFRHLLSAGLNYVEENKDNFALSQQFNLRMQRDSEGNVYLTKLEPYSYNLGILDEGMIESPRYAKFNGLCYEAADIYFYKEYTGDPLWIQFGTEAGQHSNIYINSMYNAVLGTDAVDVTTRERAQASIDYLDVALEYALDQATSVGAYLERMEYTEANVTNEAENTQAAESTMRDADMAKEMVAYAKHNVLLQSSQSIFAQSNQVMSSVLGLLQ